MALESATYINGLVVTNPTGTDPRAQGDDHIRLVKSTLKNTFPNVDGAVTMTDTELNSITAKADLASPTLTGTPAAPTATFGTDTTQIATTAFVQDAMAAVYPVGSVYISTVSTNPNTLFGFGTWTAFGAGRTLVGIDAGDTDFDTVEETGGAKTHTLTEAEMPAHSHNYAGGEYSGAYDYGTNMSVNNLGTATDGRTNNYDTSTVGSGNAHNNLQPYIVTYMWKRTA